MRGSFSAFLLVLTLVAPASAQDAEGAHTADDLIEQGIQLREAGDDEAALARFEAAFALDGAPRPEAQLGLCLLALGRFVEAADHLEAAVATRDAWIDTNRTALETALETARAHTGFVELVGGSPGARVSIEGVARGTLPLSAPVRTSTGRVVVRVEHAGHHTFEGEAVIEAGATTRLRVNLVERSAEPTPEHDVTAEGWFWPVVLGGAALAIGGGIAIGLAVDAASQPAPLEGSLGLSVMTLRL